jgi:hypothetical protein
VYSPAMHTISEGPFGKEEGNANPTKSSQSGGGHELLDELEEL